MRSGSGMGRVGNEHPQSESPVKAEVPVGGSHTQGGPSSEAAAGTKAAGSRAGCPPALLPGPVPPSSFGAGPSPDRWLWPPLPAVLTGVFSGPWRCGPGACEGCWGAAGCGPSLHCLQTLEGGRQSVYGQGQLQAAPAPEPQQTSSGRGPLSAC